MSITQYQSNRIMDRNFGGVAFTVDGTFYFGLSTTLINFDGTGATEPSGAAAYAREAFVNTKAGQWGSAAAGIITNVAAITFTESTGSWGTITYVFIADALSGGNILYFEALTSFRTVATLTTVLFAAGGVSVKMNNT